MGELRDKWALWQRQQAGGESVYGQLVFGDGTTLASENIMAAVKAALPSSATHVVVHAVGSGGGGGSGRRGAAASVRAGGGGGAGGCYTTRTFGAKQIRDATAIAATVAPGGAGGAAVTVDSTSGVAGGNGVNTILALTTGGHEYQIIAERGNGGAGGAAAAAAGGTAITGLNPGQAGAASSATGGVGVSPAQWAGLGASGAGSGGGITSGNVPSNGGGTAYRADTGATVAAGGVGIVDGGAGGSGTPRCSSVRLAGRQRWRWWRGAPHPGRRCGRRRLARRWRRWRLSVGQRLQLRRRLSVGYDWAGEDAQWNMELYNWDSGAELTSIRTGHRNGHFPALFGSSNGHKICFSGLMQCEGEDRFVVQAYGSTAAILPAATANLAVHAVKLA